MARKIDVIFNLIDNFTSPLKKTLSTMTAGTKKAQNAWKSVEKFGDGISSMGTKMVATVTAPLVGLAAASASEFGNVDKSLKLVQKTMGSTDSEAKVLESAIKTAASNSVYGMQDAADAALNFARQGFDAAQAANMIAPAMDLAAGTATDLSTVTGGLGNAMKMFSDQGLQANTAADMLATAQAQANTTVQDLLDSMAIAGPMFDTVGWSLKDLAVATDVFGDASISGSEGATALKTGLARLASPAKDGQAAMKQLGLSFFDTSGKMDDLYTMQKKLHASFAGLSDQEKLSAASAMFGKEQASRWISLIDQSPETFEKYSQGLEQSTNSANEMANALLSGPGGAVEKLKSSFDVFRYTVGDTVSYAILPFVEKATELLDKFNNMDESQQKQIVKWGAMAAAIGPGVVTFGKVISSMGKAGVSINKMIGIAAKAAGGFKKLHSAAGIARAAIAMFTSPVAVALAMLGLFAIIILSVKNHFDVFKAGINSTSPTFEKLKASFQVLKDAVQVLVERVKEVAPVLGSVIAGACGVAISALAGLLSGIAGIATGIIEVIRGIVTFVSGVFAGDWEKAWTGIKDIFKGIADVIGGIITGIINAIGGIVDGVKGLVGLKKTDRTSSVEKISGRAIGDRSWRGGLVQVHERGGEILDLPQGTRIYPHDVSIQMAKSGGNQTLNLEKIADTIVVREDADIEKIAEALVRKMKASASNMGGVAVAGMA